MRQPRAGEMQMRGIGVVDRRDKAVLPVGRLQVDGRYADDMFKDALNDPLIATDAYWVWNARASVALPNNWEIAVWGKNLADEEYVTQGVNNLPLGFGFRVYGTPRTFGLTVSKAFQ